MTQIRNLVALDGMIKNISLPSVCKIPLCVQQHVLDVLHVEKGQEVVEGECIAMSSTAPHVVHAPISGIVRGKEEIVTLDHRRCEALVIELGGMLNLSGMKARVRSWRNRSRRSLHAKIIQSGIPLLATLPSPDIGLTEQHFLINACEREPLLSVDRKLIQNYSQEIFEGVRILQSIYPKVSVTFCLDWRDKEARAHLEALLHAQSLDWHIQIVKNKRHFFYISDAMLAKNILKQSHVSAKVFNAADMRAVYESIVFDKPAIEKIVAVGGTAIRRPQFLKARIGTPIAQLIRECGGFIKIPDKIVVGGALTGHTVSFLASPFTMDCVSITAMMNDDARHAPELPCIRCGSCSSICPVHIDPHILFKLLREEKTEAAAQQGLDLCIECGLCAHVCPSRIPLLNIFKEAKHRV